MMLKIREIKAKNIITKSGLIVTWKKLDWKN